MRCSSWISTTDVSVELRWDESLHSDRKELAKAVSAVRARGRTALYDAVAEGLIHLQLGHWDKKALIIVSDGGDNASQHKYSQILELARQSQVVDLFHRLDRTMTKEENPSVLRRLSKDTGGIAFFPDVSGKRDGHLETNRPRSSRTIHARDSLPDKTDMLQFVSANTT